MNFWTLDNIRSVCGGTWLARLEAHDRVALAGVSTDSRTLASGELFVALRGHTTDGHRYIQAAAKAGAAAAIVDRKDAVPQLLLDELPRSFAVLLVHDSGAALLRLAGAYRKSLETTKVIAVAGSNGKTTTVRLIHAVLGRSLRGSASIKSYNNAVGVPLTILGAKRGDQYLVCEVGTNAPGEIATLGAVVQPDIAVVTSIGREHLEGLGSLEGVVQEEASILACVRSGGLAAVTADAPAEVARMLSDLSRQASASGRTVVRFGFAPDADLRITATEPGLGGTRFCINGRAWYEVPLLGRHNAANATAAVAAARRFGIEHEQIVAGLRAAPGAEMRLQLAEVAGVRFLNDAYNANPDSVLAALRAFEECCPIAPGIGRRIVVLGDMLELGAHSAAAHDEVAEALAMLPNVDLAVFVGALSSAAAGRARGLSRAQVLALGAGDENLAPLASLLRPGDTVLLKGSRGMRLERVIALWRGVMEPASAFEAPARAARRR